TVGPPAAITATSGGGQSTLVSTNFAAPLVATVTDQFGTPLSGVTVTFAAPVRGASATFPNGNTVTTDALGQTSMQVAASGVTGTYGVAALVSGVSPFATFALTNNTSVSHPPIVINPIGPQTVVDRGTLSFTVSTQGGNGSPITFSLGSGAPAGASINSQTGL